MSTTVSAPITPATSPRVRPAPSAGGLRQWLRALTRVMSDAHRERVPF